MAIPLSKDCPLLPTVDNYYSRVLQPIIVDLQYTLLYDPENFIIMEGLLKKIPNHARLGLLSEFLAYFLQCCRFGDDATQCARILNILKLCPPSASSKNSEGMTSLHYFCMRNKGMCDLPILFKILEIDPDLPKVQNNFGESPLHQLVGQSHPDPKVLGILLKSCPDAFKQAIACSNKYPLHVILANPRLNFNFNCMEAAKLVMTGVKSRRIQRYSSFIYVTLALALNFLSVILKLPSNILFLQSLYRSKRT